MSGVNETLRQQLHELTLSMEEMETARTETARKAEKKGKEQQEEFESRYKVRTIVFINVSKRVITS